MSNSLLIGFPGGSVVKNPPAKQKTPVWSLGREDPLEEDMATHSSILAWENPMDRVALQATSPWSRKRVKHNLMTKQQQKVIQ